MAYETYHIPVNFTDAGRLFGIFEIRNAIEAMGTYYGVVKTEVASRGWSGWCKIPYIEYYE